MSEPIFTVAAFCLGAIVGSFLNACIHRMPRDISLLNPRRSFCPSCQKPIPWYENLPIVSWLALRGRCSGCGARISARYFLVEVLTGGLFLLAWRWFQLPLAPVYWLFLSILIAATFIDIEHFIIPDIFTWGGAVAGLAASAAVPELMEQVSRLEALKWSAIGAALGFGLIWSIVELGKLAFGRKRHAFEEPEKFTWKREEAAVTLTIGEETLDWFEIFYRKSDVLVMEEVDGVLDGEPLAAKAVRFREGEMTVDGASRPLETIGVLSGTMKAVVIPREAMGAGDVKFMAAIGAFLGWKAILFTICAASVIGCLAAVAGLFMARDKSGVRMPFGPFLAAGAAIWVFVGPILWNWYFGLSGGCALEF